MKRILVWDLPVRIFHWLLAGSFLGAFLIANVVDDESTLFAMHMWLGGTAAFMVVLRILWGFVGSRHARFESFNLSPAALVRSLKGTFTAEGERHTGHNPATSLAAIAMFVIVLGLGVTGAFMSSGGEAFEEIHEMLAWTMMAIVGVHVAGIIWHSLRHRENIARSMIDGKKQAEPAGAIPRTHVLATVAFLALTGLWAGGLYEGYDAATQRVTVPIVGSTLQLGESEDEDEEHGDHEQGHEEHDEEHAEYEDDD